MRRRPSATTSFRLLQNRPMVLQGRGSSRARSSEAVSDCPTFPTNCNERSRLSMEQEWQIVNSGHSPRRLSTRRWTTPSVNDEHAHPERSRRRCPPSGNTDVARTAPTWTMARKFAAVAIVAIAAAARRRHQRRAAHRGARAAPAFGAPAERAVGVPRRAPRVGPPRRPGGRRRRSRSSTGTGSPSASPSSCSASRSGAAADSRRGDAGGRRARGRVRAGAAHRAAAPRAARRPRVRTRTAETQTTPPPAGRRCRWRSRW